MKELRVIDLCCGAGGWACAARGLPIEVVAAVDMWDVCHRTHKLNYPETLFILGDLREADVQEQILAVCGDQIDVVLGAIPCEWLSAQRRTPHNRVTAEERERERRTLEAVLGLVESVAPRHWVLEDVKGLAEELPEGVPWVQIDSEHYSAQRRKRIYVGQFPPPMLQRCACGDVLADKLRPGPYRIGRRAADRQLVTADAFRPDTAYAMLPQKKSATVCAWSSRRDASLVISDPGLPGGRRQVEWQEAAVLQGFPEDYVFYGSPTDVWKMIAQAIQIDTGRAILEEIVRAAQQPRVDLCGSPLRQAIEEAKARDAGLPGQ